MNKRNKILVVITVLIISYVGGISVGIYFYYSNIKYHENNNDLSYNEQNKIQNNLDNSLILQKTKEVSKNLNKTNEDTKIVYKMFYKDTQFTETIEDKVPYFIVGLTREEVQQQFKDWTLESFSNNEIILKKVIENSDSEKYFLSEYNGNIAVFSGNKLEENLIEVTNKPVISLPEEEQIKIKKGIYIKGKKELINYIQDYES